MKIIDYTCLTSFSARLLLCKSAIHEKLNPAVAQKTHLDNTIPPELNRTVSIFAP